MFVYSLPNCFNNLGCSGVLYVLFCSIVNKSSNSMRRNAYICLSMDIIYKYLFLILRKEFSLVTVNFFQDTVRPVSDTEFQIYTFLHY